VDYWSIILETFQKLRAFGVYNRWWRRWWQYRQVDSVDILTPILNNLYFWNRLLRYNWCSCCSIWQIDWKFRCYYIHLFFILCGLDICLCWWFFWKKDLLWWFLNLVAPKDASLTARLLLKLIKFFNDHSILTSKQSSSKALVLARQAIVRNRCLTGLIVRTFSCTALGRLDILDIQTILWISKWSDGVWPLLLQVFLETLIIWIGLLRPCWRLHRNCLFYLLFFRI